MSTRTGRSPTAVGDEAPGGDNPTPDQDVVDDIGKALGVQYEDNEELKGADKIAERDKHRWELDPASSEDYPDRDSDGCTTPNAPNPKIQGIPNCQIPRTLGSWALGVSSCWKLELGSCRRFPIE